MTDMRTTLFRHVENLEPDVRATVHAHYYQDLTLQETANALGVATSTVKYRLRQALAELQRKLSPERILTTDKH
jgi:RNA polymerase sigma factor (sigma-70 family)